MKTIFKLIQLSIILLLFSTNVKSEDYPYFYDTEIKLEVPKTNYRFYEPIIINFKVINKSEIGPILTIPYPNGWIIKDENGKKINGAQLISWAETPRLKKDQIVDIRTSLTQYSNNIYKDYKYIVAAHSPGKYYITYQYAWERECNQIISNTITIIVKEPNKEEREVLSIINEGFRLHSKLKNHTFKEHNRKYREKSKEKFIYVVENYPNSIYAPQALYQLCRRIELKYNEQMIYDYPEFPKVYRCLYNIVKYFRIMGNEEEMPEYFTDMSSRVDENTKIKITDILERIENGDI